jgi:hypothetical protein
VNAGCAGGWEKKPSTKPASKDLFGFVFTKLLQNSWKFREKISVILETTKARTMTRTFFPPKNFTNESV